MRGFTELKRVLETKWETDAFSVLADVSLHIDRDVVAGRELVIRALDARGGLSGIHREIINELAVAVGLHPYVDDLEPLSLKSSIQHCSHRVDGGDDDNAIMGDVVLHSSQAKVFRALLAGESVILSAPTSFGKSLLIDALISRKDYPNIVLILPTLALVEETRRRMAKFANKYKVITSGDGKGGDRNIYVLTQERYLSMEIELESNDFFAIDEFYKLSLQTGEGGERATQLNQAFLKLLRSNAQFYMLGPSIRSIPDTAEESLDCRFFVENFQTVASELHILPTSPTKDSVFVKTISEISGQTMVYCQSPKSARKLMEFYLQNENLPDTTVPELLDAAAWTARSYHPDWLISKALRKGIGIHHGRLPRALGRFMVRAFEDQKIETLLCTSTLIEGVNTSAKNVIVYDHKLNRRNLDFFTFNNIRGRTGRMFKHFVGHVYVFKSPPQEQLPYVDMAAIEPTEQTPSSILMQFDASEIPSEAQERYSSLIDNKVVSTETLLKNSGIEPELMIATAKFIGGLTAREIQKLQWSNRPAYDDIGFTSELIWDHLGGANSAKRSGVHTHRMMTYWIRELYKSRSVPKFFKSMLGSQIDRGVEPDVAVEDILAFLRGWASFNYPKYLIALSDLCEELLNKRGYKPGNFYHFAADIEHLFQPVSFSSLEEYGLPAEISEKLLRANLFAADDEIESVVSTLKSKNLTSYADNAFEKAMIEDFQTGI